MKQRRQFIRKLGGLTALLAFAIPGNARIERNEALEGNFVHVVFF